MEYLVILIYALIIANRWQKTSDHKRFRTSYMILFIACVLLFGLRYRVGVDTLNYMYSYGDKPDLSKLTWDYILASNEAPFYTLLNSICKTFSSSFYLLQIVVTVIFNSCLFVFLKRHSQNPFLGFAVFFFMNGLYFNTEILKESLAVGVFLLNIDNLLKRRWYRYYGLALISLMFHYSAIIIFVFPFLRWLKFNWAFIGLIVVFFLGSKILAEQLIPLITFASAANLIDRYTLMLEQDRLNINWIIFALLQAVLIPLAMLLSSKYGKWKIGRMEFLVCLCVLLGAGCVYFELVFQRFSNYVSIVYAVCLADFFLSKEINKLYKTGVFMAFMVIYTFSYITHDRISQWVPYHSIFNEQKEPVREDIWFDQFGRIE